MKTEKQVLSHFKNWATENDNVRCAILTSSRTIEGSVIDFLSDYDIELYVSDISPFIKNDDWLELFGEIMVKWPYEPKSTEFEKDWITRLVLFKDGVRIDFQITDKSKIAESHYENGYRILIDKDGLTNNLKDPTYSKYIIKKPSKKEYEELTNEFWWSAYYVPKYLWRDELPFAKYMLDYTLRYEYLHKIIDWYIGSKNNWSVETGIFGRKYKKLLPKDIWEEFENTYEGKGINENWQAFDRLTNFFRKIAIEVGNRLGYKYPQEVDNEVMIFCEKIKETKK